MPRKTVKEVRRDLARGARKVVEKIEAGEIQWFGTEEVGCRAPHKATAPTCALGHVLKEAGQEYLTRAVQKEAHEGFSLAELFGFRGPNGRQSKFAELVDEITATNDVYGGASNPSLLVPKLRRFARTLTK